MAEQPQTPVQEVRRPQDRNAEAAQLREQLAQMQKLMSQAIERLNVLEADAKTDAPKSDAENPEQPEVVTEPSAEEIKAKQLQLARELIGAQLTSDGSPTEKPNADLKADDIDALITLGSEVDDSSDRQKARQKLVAAKNIATVQNILDTVIKRRMAEVRREQLPESHPPTKTSPVADLATNPDASHEVVPPYSPVVSNEAAAPAEKPTAPQARYTEAERRGLRKKSIPDLQTELAQQTALRDKLVATTPSDKITTVENHIDIDIVNRKLEFLEDLIEEKNAGGKGRFAGVKRLIRRIINEGENAPATGEEAVPKAEVEAVAPVTEATPAPNNEAQLLAEKILAPGTDTVEKHRAIADLVTVAENSGDPSKQAEAEAARAKLSDEIREKTRKNPLHAEEMELVADLVRLAGDPEKVQDADEKAGYLRQRNQAIDRLDFNRRDLTGYLSKDARDAAAKALDTLANDMLVPVERFKGVTAPELPVVETTKAAVLNPTLASSERVAIPVIDKTDVKPAAATVTVNRPPVPDSSTAQTVVAGLNDTASIDMDPLVAEGNARRQAAAEEAKATNQGTAVPETAATTPKLDQIVRDLGLNSDEIARSIEPDDADLDRLKKVLKLEQATYEDLDTVQSVIIGLIRQIQEKPDDSADNLVLVKNYTDKWKKLPQTAA